ncbi:MAG: RNA 2',3'-cyclic phosphodiesterase [Prolixibacteraceae bacterium]|jgi:2'-5' RNA ligase|nr:RNA 2',3'-cyclic phosphodiesterase [Prolixibacteraceae bacterium]
MTTGKRIFLAIKIQAGPELLDVVDFLHDELAREQIRWVGEEQFHITLKFFGDTPEDKMELISAAVEECCMQYEPFSFGLCSPGYFRDREQLRVIFLQTSGTETLVAFQKQTEHLLSGLGIPKEDRVFRPHLTLGRIKSVRDARHFYELMKQFPQKTVQVVFVSELILFESILKPSGPEYRVLERFRLKKGRKTR